MTFSLRITPSPHPFFLLRRFSFNSGQLLRNPSSLALLQPLQLLLLSPTVKEPADYFQPGGWFFKLLPTISSNSFHACCHTHSYTHEEWTPTNLIFLLFSSSSSLLEHSSLKTDLKQHNTLLLLRSSSFLHEQNIIHSASPHNQLSIIMLPIL